MVFGRGNKDDDDLDELDDLEDNKKPVVGEKSEMRLFLFVIISCLVVLFSIVVLLNVTTISTINNNTNQTLTGLNQSASKTLTTIEINSNETDQKINTLANTTSSLANATANNTVNVANNTKNINSLYDYIKQIIDTETPKNNEFKENITSLVENVSKVVNVLEERLANNNTGKITENNIKTNENNMLLKEIFKLLQQHTGSGCIGELVINCKPGQSFNGSQ